MEKTRFLQQIPFLADAAPDLRQEVLDAAVPQHLPQGTIFFHEGDYVSHFAIIISGKVRVYKLAESGRAITLYHVNPGEACLLNMSCLLADARCSATAEAEADTEVLLFPADSFRGWMAKYEPLRRYVFHLYSTRLAGVLQLVEEISFRKMDQRLANHLANLFAQQEKLPAVLEVTHAQIADDLGSAREVVSRLLKDFERLGAIRLSRGRIDLEDSALLRSLGTNELHPG